MGAGTYTIDSNVTGLSFAEEVLGTPATLPGTPVWYPFEPNSYNEFGAQVKTVKREPINASRQKRKGSLTGVDVSASFTTDFMSKSMYIPMKGFMFADWREKDNLLPTAVTSTQYTVASGGAAFTSGVLLYAEGFGVSGNNGLKVLTTNGTGTAVTAPGLAAEASPPTDARITRVGFQGAAGDVTLTVAGSIVTLGSTSLNFTTQGLIPGEWLFVGGDSAATAFATAACNGWYRIKSVAANAVVCDRYPTGAATDSGATKTIQLFYGHVIKNEATNALQKFYTYTFERSLGVNKFQYEKGCGANSLALNVKTGDKVTADLSFMGMSEETTTVAKTGTRKTLPREASFNAATSFSRIRVSDEDGSNLTGILTDLKLTIENGIEGIEGITSTLGKVDLSSGDFTVSGTVEAYFSTLAAVDAIKRNPDASIDFAMVENVGTNGTGWLFDVPLVMLSDARLKVEKDKPIKLPLTLDAAGHNTLDHTLLVQRYAYLPQLAL